MTPIVAACLVFTALNPVFDRANLAFKEGDYPKAVQDYQEVLAEGGEHPAVYYNLGNAYYRNGELGAAIAAYESALRLDPKFENARQNRDLALSDTQRALAKPLPPGWQQALLFWDNNLTTGAVRTLFVIFNVLFWTTLAVRLLRPMPFTRMLAVLLFVCAAITGLSTWAKGNPIRLAVAAEASVPVRYGMADDETVRFELYAGDRIAVEARQADWIRVRTIEGERGWARAKSFAYVAPHNESVVTLDAAS